MRLDAGRLRAGANDAAGFARGQVVFRMDVLGQIEAAGRLVINPPRGIEAAVDKYLATAGFARPA